MPATQTVFQHHVYRDFALIALAALGVGLLFSLSIATAIVLTNPGHTTSSQVTGPLKTRYAMSAPTVETMQHQP